MSTNCRLERPTAVIMPASRDVAKCCGSCSAVGQDSPQCSSSATHCSLCSAVTKQRAEHPAKDGVGQRGEQRGELSDGAQDEHDPSAVLNHPPAPHLHGGMQAVRGGGCDPLGMGSAQIGGTLVMPSTPMLGLEEVEPLPVPISPAMMQEMPSVKMPLGDEQRVPFPAAA